MGNNTFDPRSRQQDERPIIRSQNDFKAGMFRDIPASNISEAAVADLKNFINHGDSLTGRTGTKQWSESAIPAKVSSISITWTISSGERTVTATSGTPFTFDDIGNWIKFSDGTIEKIIDYTSSTVVETKTTVTTASGSDTVDVRGHVNAFYFHKGNKKVIAHVDNRILMADDLTMTGWTECIRNSIIKPSNNDSTFDEFEKYAILFNTNGMFKINLDQDPPIYFRMNTPVSNTKVTTSGVQSSGTPYGYKYVYSLTRMPGFGNRNRQTPGVNIEMETGTNVVDDNFNDYGVLWSASGVGSGNPLVGGSLTNSLDPIDPTSVNQEPTHYSLYRTMDIGTNGTDVLEGEGNNTELFVWVEDIPVGKALTVTVSGTTCTNTVGYFEDMDIGSVINVYDGTAEYERTIASRTSSTVVELASALPSGATSQPACIGAGTLMSASQSGNVVTSEASGLFTFASGDIGKTIYWTDGDYSIISGLTSSTVVGVADSETRSAQGAMIDPRVRNFRDVLADRPEDGESWTLDQLSSRIAGYTLQNRFWTAVPNGNLGVIVPGFTFVAPANSKFLYYSQLPIGYEYMMGHYNAGYQFTRLKDAINNLIEYPNSVIVRCKTSTYDIPINTFNEVIIEGLGEYVAVISAQNLVDESIGSTDKGGSVWTDEGLEYVITNEPAIRLFNGQKYGENIATDRIMDDLRKMNAAYAATYDPFNGFIFWASDE